MVGFDFHFAETNCCVFLASGNAGKDRYARPLRGAAQFYSWRKGSPFTGALRHVLYLVICSLAEILRTLSDINAITMSALQRELLKKGLPPLPPTGFRSHGWECPVIVPRRQLRLDSTTQYCAVLKHKLTIRSSVIMIDYDKNVACCLFYLKCSPKQLLKLLRMLCWLRVRT